MYVITVIPLTKTASLETLSYYATQSYEPGTIITVPLRKRTVSAVVVNTEPVSNAKTALRAATFSLRRLPAQPDAPILPPSLLQTATAVSNELPAHVGSILFSLLPPDIRTGQRPYPFIKTYENNTEHTTAVLTALRHDRHISYRSLIRQCFAHRGSVLLVVPQSALVAELAAALESGIQKRIVTFASTHTKKQIDDAYERFTDFSTAKLIITTPAFAFLDRHDITTIIIDDCGSTYYKSKTRPYLDAGMTLRRYAEITKRTLILGDTLPPTEYEVPRRNELLMTHDEHPQRLSFSNTCSVVAPPKPVREKPLPLLSESLQNAIAHTLTAKGRIFLLSARRGFSPLIICNDCGHILRCPDSGAPFSLYTTTGEDGAAEQRWLFCSTSGVRIEAFDTCPECHSWRLREQGIGIQRIVAAVREQFPDYPVITFDHTTASTSTKAKRLQRQFYDTKGVIMVGTAMALPYLTKGYQLGGIISYEALRAYPSWRAEETVLRTLLTLREQAEQTLLIQSRDSDDPLLGHVKRGSIDLFYNEEIAMRQLLSYPPFTTLIHLTWQGTKAQLAEQEAFVQSTLGHIDMQCYNNPAPRTTPMRHALIKIPHDNWPNPALVAKLRSLPPSIRIEIAPERII